MCPVANDSSPGPLEPGDSRTRSRARNQQGRRTGSWARHRKPPQRVGCRSTIRSHFHREHRAAAVLERTLALAGIKVAVPAICELTGTILHPPSKETLDPIVHDTLAINVEPPCPALILQAREPAGADTGRFQNDVSILIAQGHLVLRIVRDHGETALSF